MFWNDYYHILLNNILELLHQCLLALTICILFTLLMQSINTTFLIVLFAPFGRRVVFASDIVPQASINASL